MPDDFVLSQLNEQQLDIVCRPKDEDILVIAGAGTGKTRVLISRVCSLIETEGVSPHAILAVTFTNKAALEMKERLIKAMHMEPNEFHMWVMTFHGLCARLLHMFASQALLPSNFTVLGPRDQQHIIKDFLSKNDFSKQFTASRGLKPKDVGVDTNSILKYINERKEKGMTCSLHTDTILEYMNNFQSAWIHNSVENFLEIMFGIYTVICERSGAVDFNELILRTLWLLKNNEEVRSRLNYRFSHILVDEFQDTDKAQYQLMRLLRGEHGHVFVVGDDDQAIYGWRGADYENLKRLATDIPDIKVMPLSINYRSTQNILNFANSLIFHDPERIFKKRLFTPETFEEQRRLNPEADALELVQNIPHKIFDPNAPKVTVCRIDHEFYEGAHVTNLVQVLHKKFRVPLSEIAILYRKNALSSAIERSLNAENIPYQIYGGLKFYEREEILDAMAYLRLMSNSNDDVALGRVYNVPKRKIGPTSWSRLSAFANSCGCSVYQAVQKIKAQPHPPRDIMTVVKKFDEVFALIERMRQEVSKRSLPNLIDYMIKESGLLHHYSAVDREKGNARTGTSKVDNLKQLIINAEYFMQFASLQDVDVESMELDEVLPLPQELLNSLQHQTHADNADDELAYDEYDDNDYDDDDEYFDNFELEDDADVLVVDNTKANSSESGRFVAKSKRGAKQQQQVASSALPSADSAQEDELLVSEELLTSKERSARRRVEIDAYVEKFSAADNTSPAQESAPSTTPSEVTLEQLKHGQHHNQKKDHLTLAAERSASTSLEEQQSLGALADKGFSPLELLNSFLRGAALTSSAESNVVGQIPLAGLSDIDQGLAEHLQAESRKALEADIVERAQTDLDAFKDLGDLKGGKKKNELIDSVQLMTIHAAKGLEFEAVIVIGCEENIMPSYFALHSERDQDEALAEERRLAYVAFTRAKRYLVATFNQAREVQYGIDFGMQPVEPSRFLREAEAETKHYGPNAPFINTPLNYSSSSEALLTKLFTTEAEQQAKQKARKTSPKVKTGAQLLVEAVDNAKGKRNALGKNLGRPRRQKVDFY